MSLSHVRFLVDDPAADTAFYRDVVGLRQVVDVPGVYAELDAGGGARLAFYRADLMRDVTGAQSGPSSGDVVVCLRVDDVDAASARLVGAGARLLRAPHDQPAWSQRVAHHADSSGRVVELWSPLDVPG